MKKIRDIVLLFVLSALALVPMQASAEATDPVQVVKDYIATANSGDFDNTLAFYADDAIVKNAVGLFVGKEQIAGWLKQDVQTTHATPETFQAMGNLVVNTGTVSLARLKQLGIESVQYHSEYIIENGKIRFFSPYSIFTPEQQAIVRAASANAPVPASAPGEPDPQQVVKDYITSANTGDFDKTFAFYADNAIVKTPLGLTVGKEAIGQFLKQDVQTTRATPQTFQVTGNMVVNTGTVSLARFEKLGIGPIGYRSEYVIENGKIRYFSPVSILTAEQQAKVRAASSAPTALPQTGGMPFASQLWLPTIFAAIVLFALGLVILRRTRRA